MQRVLQYVFLLLTLQLQASHPLASVHALGMGGASVAYGQDALTPFYNPATAICTERRFDVGMHAVFQKKDLSLQNRPSDPPNLQTGAFCANDDWVLYGEFGVNTNVCFCNTRLAFGLQYNHYDHIRTRFHAILQDFGGISGGSKAKFDWRAEVLTFTGAYSWNRCHHFGLGVNVYFSWLTIEGMQRIVTDELTIDPSRVTNRRRDSAEGVGVTFGYLGQVCNHIWLGLSWSPKVSMNRFGRYSGFLADDAIDIPETWRIGLACQCNPCTVFAADWEYRLYERIASLANAFPGSGSIGAPSSAFGFGASNGPGFGWKNTWILRLGIDRCFSDWLTGRIGYRHKEGPIGSKGTKIALNALTLNTIEDSICFGLTWKIDSCCALSCYSDFGLSKDKRARFPDVTMPEDVQLWAPADTKMVQFTYACGIGYGHKF